MKEIEKSEVEVAARWLLSLRWGENFGLGHTACFSAEGPPLSPPGKSQPTFHHLDLVIFRASVCLTFLFTSSIVHTTPRRRQSVNMPPKKVARAPQENISLGPSARDGKFIP